MAKKNGRRGFAGKLGKFRLIDNEGWIGGVCAGIAYYFGIRAWLVRLLLVLVTICYGVGIIPYVLLWIFVPDAGRTPSDYEERCG